MFITNMGCENLTIRSAGTACDIRRFAFVNWRFAQCCRVKFENKSSKLFEDRLRFANEFGDQFFIDVSFAESLADLHFAFNPHHDRNVGLGVDFVAVWSFCSVERRHRHLADLVFFGGRCE